MYNRNMYMYEYLSYQPVVDPTILKGGRGGGVIRIYTILNLFTLNRVVHYYLKSIQLYSSLGERQFFNPITTPWIRH